MRRSVVAAGSAGFIASRRLRANPYPLYRAMRRLDPVHASPFGLWIVAGHAEVSAALREPLLGSDESKADQSVLKMGPLMRLLGRDAGDPARNEFLRRFSETMLLRDPPDHTRLRALVAKAFTPKRVEALAPRGQELVDEMLDGRHGRIDVMRDLAYPLPTKVICELFGVPEADHLLLMGQAPALAIGLDPPPLRTPETLRAAERATRTLVDYLGGLVDERRRQPGDDLLSALISAEEDGQQLTKDELISNLILLLLAGHETTANLVGNGLMALLEHPAQLSRLREEPGVEASAVEELLRYDPPAQMVRRITLDTVTVGGATIPPGRFVVLLIAAANRDPLVFRRPHELDLGRDPNPHLAFAAGPHFCIGAALARLEGRIVLATLARRFPGMALVRGSAVRRKSFTIRGFTRLEVSLS